MTYWTRDGLTAVEREVHQQQARERVMRERCGICVHRGEQVWGTWTCDKGQKWPKRGICQALSVKGG